ncbi:A/G-specific adenine glycosylase [Sulfurimonas sp.]|nr:A/G-specific adenine glycosylase [Sulfurimonas sp.]
MLSTKQRNGVQQNLLAWYEKEGRDHLPWRQTDNIYHVYLSEIMLQQTQVSRVMDEYYPRFLKRFPDLKALSEATLEEVFSCWSGLGYYRRAKNLHATSQLTTPTLPDTMKELLELPGIGKYTASAICSFGYNQSVSVVDTNIARVLGRLYAKETPKDKELWEIADSFLNHVEARSHNLALMDLGSMICTPKNPTCKSCPFEEECLGKNEPELYSQKKKTLYIDKTLYYGIFQRDDKVAMYRSESGMYKDMLELKELDAKAEGELLGTFKHAYTKYRLEVYVYKIDMEGDKAVWIDKEKFAEAPISSLTTKALGLLNG